MGSLGIEEQEPQVSATLGLSGLSCDEVEQIVIKIREMEAFCERQISIHWMSTSMMAQWRNQSKNYQACRSFLGDISIFKWINGEDFEWKLPLLK